MPDTMSRLNLTISQLAKARTAEREGLGGEAGRGWEVLLPGYILGHQIYSDSVTSVPPLSVTR